MLWPEWAESKETNQTKHTPYLIHKIELWGVYCKHFGETWYYNAIALYFGGASVKLWDSHGNIFPWGDFVMFMKYFLSMNFFLSLTSLHIITLTRHVSRLWWQKTENILQGVPPGKFWNKKTHLEHFGAFWSIIKIVLGGSKLMEMS